MITFRDLRVVAAFFFFGPPVGLVVAVIIGELVRAAVSPGETGAAALVASLILTNPLVVIFGTYVIGGLSALAAGIAYAVISRRVVPARRRLWFNFLAGVIATAIGPAFIMYGLSFSVSSILQGLGFALAGGVAALVAAMVVEPPPRGQV